MAAKTRKLSGWIIALIVVAILALVAAVVWVLCAAQAMVDDGEIDTWAEGLGQLGIVGAGMDAALSFWDFLKRKTGGTA